METGSSTKDRKAEIDRCLDMIKPAASDESKFVGMFILPKLLDQQDLDMITRVFDGMNFKFIERLLRTNHVTDAEIPDPVLKEIAVNILGCFARYESLASQQNMVDRIPGLSRILSASDVEQTTEVLAVLSCVAIHKQGLVKMLDPDVLKNVFEVLLGTESQDVRTKCTQLILSVYARSCQLLHQESIPSLTSALTYSLNTLMSVLSKVLDKNQKLLKFEALEILSNVLPDIPAIILKQFKTESESKLETWLKALLSGLRQILSSKQTEIHRDRAILLASCSLRAFGNDWLFSSLEQTKQAKRKAEKDPHNTSSSAVAIANFPALLIHLVAIETRIMLDDISDRISREYNEEKTIHTTQKARQETMLPVYFEVIEYSIEYLAAHYDEHQESGMDPEMLLKLRTTYTETMDPVMEVLQFMQKTRENLDDDPIAQACIRIVSLWTAEEGIEI